MLDKILNELIPKQAEEIKKAVRDGIPIMIVDNTGSGCEAREKLRCELKANNAILIPDTVAEFRKYNTAYLRIELNIEGGEGMSDSKNTAPLTPYDENGFKEAEVIVKKDGSLEIRPKER